MFDSERFVEDCRQAAEEGPRAIRELVAAAVADPRGVLSALGEPEAAGVQKL
jgi:hypothetical protein